MGLSKVNICENAGWTDLQLGGPSWESSESWTVWCKESRARAAQDTDLHSWMETPPLELLATVKIVRCVGIWNTIKFSNNFLSTAIVSMLLYIGLEIWSKSRTDKQKENIPPGPPPTFSVYLKLWSLKK